MKQFDSPEAFVSENFERPVFLCIGNFDGVHRGHRALLDLAKNAASADNGLCGVLTFSPHPEVFFRGNGAVKLIYSQAAKAKLFERAGMDFAIFYPFTKEFAALSADEFLPHLREFIPTLAGIFVGENFCYGARRSGDVATLKRGAGALGIRVHALSPVLFEGEKISSTRIRECLEAGNTEAANAMLSENYCASGTLEPGRQLGRTIGFPTLNLPWRPELRPRFGVYAVRVKWIREGETHVFGGVANYGVRPTVERECVPDPLLEVHLLSLPEGAPVPNYGDFIEVEYLHFLRPEKRFESLDALKAQLAQDRRRAEACLSSPSENCV